MGVPIPTFGDTSVEDVSGLLGLEPLVCALPRLCLRAFLCHNLLGVFTKDVQKDSNIRVSAAASPTDAELSKKVM
jgi:hypothetical protein